MARVIGYVKSFEHGTFFVKDAKGHSHQLKSGEAIHEGELVYGAKSNPNNAKIIIDVTLQGAGDLVIAGTGALNFDTSLLKGIFVHDDAVVYINSIKDALALNGNTAPDSETDKKHIDVTPGEEDSKEDETAAGNVVTDTEHTTDTFAVRDGSTQDVSTSVSGTGTGSTGSTSSIQSTVVTFVPLITVMVPLSTNDKTPTIIGASNLIGAIVTLVVTDSEGNEQILYTVVQPNGTYSIDVPQDLAVGEYSVNASVSDAAGNSVHDSDQGTINLFAPSISLDNLPDVTNDNTPTISGTSDQIGGTVTLIVTSPGGGLQVLHALVQNDGTFSTEVPSSLLDGTFTVEARVYSSDGILGEDIENAQIDTYVDVQVWAPDNSNDNQPTIYGTSDEIGATVFLKVTDSNGHVQEVTAVVNENKTYSVEVTEALADGAYTVEARVQDAVGNVANATDNGSIDTVVPTLTVDVAENTTDTTPTITGTSDEIGATVTLVVTDSAGNEQILYTEIQADGTYSIDVPEALAEGSFIVNASISDPSNNEVTANDIGTVNIDYAPTVVVTINATPVENTAAAGDVIATSAGSDADGDTLVYSLTTNVGNVYAIDPATGAVSLTQAGADLINGGGNLPSVNVTVTDPSNATGTDSEAVPATTQANDAPTVVVTINATPVENTAAAGDVIATSAGSDADGDTLVYSLTT
ncbi:MAG: Ig-like domain-containing protein, partial [Sulfuricurvum sp.]|uniref:Ig-like domain-containing protein n=1 Tax=Sulfuricurvum sp. TaxID=2025608 RepID=UPI00262BD20F